MGADKGYDNEAFVEGMRFMEATPHVAQNTKRRRSRIDARTTRHPGYAVSQVKRKRVEEIFGWLKTVALLRKVRHRGRAPWSRGCSPGGGRLQPGAHPQFDGGGDLKTIGERGHDDTPERAT